MKKKDYLVITIIILVILSIIFINRIIPRESGSYVLIHSSDGSSQTLKLADNRRIELTGNTIVINDGSVYMESADCPDKLCVKHKPVSRIGESIICLPNKLSIEITDSASPVSVDGFYFNTYISVTAYDGTSDDIINEIPNICDHYEQLCSRTSDTSELYKLNHRLTSVEYCDQKGIDHYPLSPELYDMIKVGLEYSDETDDIFNIAIAPVTDLWDFTSGTDNIPDKELIANALRYVNSSNIRLYDDYTISFANEETMIDLGGMAKGYIGDVLKNYLADNGCTNAIIALGGNIVCIGDKNGSPYTIGIQKPFDPTGSSITTIEVKDTSVITSGVYERCFEKDGRLYHHILDTRTGYPIDNDLLGLTVICDSSTMGDCLSTYIFSLGLDKAIDYANIHNDVQIIAIDKDYKIHKSTM